WQWPDSPTKPPGPCKRPPLKRLVALEGRQLLLSLGLSPPAVTSGSITPADQGLPIYTPARSQILPIPPSLPTLTTPFSRAGQTAASAVRATTAPPLPTASEDYRSHPTTVNSLNSHVTTKPV
ncbi:hypothetical protein BaRGS_00022971, partial [Batillaria attramentaria]